CLEANGLAFDDVDFFALHQASRFILDGLVRELGIPEEKMLWNLERLGNTVSSTIPTLIAEGINDGSYAGSRILVCGFGSGLSWGTNVLFA
ncbi:MAG TPA: 3-oxoacyl-[acyl-carrier-protein] synthase III C-terminal domain-containing protein, partial [Myxococcota bacterium]|nr:3-oxoacyl-[acyl-carrier-protein] synthase III C-terminal domain-containing protein [Myxococcota bacterium]